MNLADWIIPFMGGYVAGSIMQCIAMRKKRNGKS